MARLIGVLSGKGGVGKTTLVSNLGYAITELGNKVTLIDANLTTPHLGMHLGMELASKTLHDVLRGRYSINNAIYTHPLGFKVVPGSISMKALTDVNPKRLSSVVSNLSGNSDFIILDSAPGLGRETFTALKASKELLLLTSPDLPSVTDAYKTLKIAKKLDKNVLGVVVNKVKGKPYELMKKDIESMIGLPVLAEIPEDNNVQKSIAAKTLLLDYSPNSPATTEIRRLAHHLTGKEFKQKRGFLSWLFGR